MRFPSARLLAALWLALCVSCGKSDEAWRADLQDPDPFVAGLAAIGLTLQNPGAADAAIPVLLETVDRSEVGLEREAAQALYFAGPHHVDLLLRNIVEDELMSFDRLGTIKNSLVGAGPVAAGPVVNCLAGPGRERAGDLGEILLGIGDPSVPPLIQLLESRADTKLKNYTAFLLGNLGPRARPALPALQRNLNTEDAELKAALQRAIARIKGSSTGGGR